MLDINQIKLILKTNKLKVTPQRVSLLEAFVQIKHPCAEQITEYIRQTWPSIATSTVYNILEQFTKLGIIEKIKTNNGKTRYDIVTKKHHHLYCKGCDTIADYHNNELNKILSEYFENNPIPNFHIDNIELQINGVFTKHPEIN